MIKSLIPALFIGAASARLVYRDTACTAGDITSNGRTCTVECGTDHAGSDYQALAVSNFQACINACISDTNCKTAQYLTTNSYCYLKNAIGGTSSNANVNGVVCKDSASSSTTASTTKSTSGSSTSSATSAASCIPGSVTINGRLGAVECDTDRSGGDYGNVYAATFQDCENACGSDTKCETAQYVPGSQTCYLKSAINPAVQKAGVNGIVFSGSSSSSTTSSVSTTTTSVVPTTTSSSVTTTSSVVPPTTTTSSSTSSTVSTTPPASTPSTSSTTSSSTTSTTTADQRACSAGYITMNGRKAVVQCDVDYPGAQYQTQFTGSLVACENLCTADPQCAVATYDFEQGYCYLKNQASPSPSRFRADAVKILPTSTAPPSSKCTTAAPDSPYLLNGGFERGISLDVITTNDGKLPASKGTFDAALTYAAFEGCQAYYFYPTTYPYQNSSEYAFGIHYDGLQTNTNYVLTFIIGGYPDSYPGSTLHNYFRVYNDAGYYTAGIKQIGAGSICTNNTPICQIPATYQSSGKGRFYSIPFTQNADGGSAIYLVIGWGGSDPAPVIVDDIRINLPGDAPTAPAYQSS